MKWFERFCYKHQNWGVRNLLSIFAAMYVVIFVVFLFDRSILYNFYFVRDLIFAGEIWRLFAFIIFPRNLDYFWFVFMVLFTIFVGRVVERHWGCLQLTFFMITGSLLSIGCGLISNEWFIGDYTVMSLLFVYALLLPDDYITMFFAITVKIKYLALFEVGYFLYIAIISQSLLPLVAMANVSIYFWPQYARFFRGRPVHGAARTVQFKSRMQQARTTRHYKHKCVVCGLTDNDDPGMEFRYCSLCGNYACYCSKHLFGHEHIK